MTQTQKSNAQYTAMHLLYTYSNVLQCIETKHVNSLLREPTLQYAFLIILVHKCKHVVINFLEARKLDHLCDLTILYEKPLLYLNFQRYILTHAVLSFKSSTLFIM